MCYQSTQPCRSKVKQPGVSLACRPHLRVCVQLQRMECPYPLQLCNNGNVKVEAGALD